jgi:hypothetical protein
MRGPNTKHRSSVDTKKAVELEITDKLNTNSPMTNDQSDAFG